MDLEVRLPHKIEDCSVKFEFICIFAATSGNPSQKT